MSKTKKAWLYCDSMAHYYLSLNEPKPKRIQGDERFYVTFELEPPTSVVSQDAVKLLTPEELEPGQCIEIEISSGDIWEPILK